MTMVEQSAQSDDAAEGQGETMANEYKQKGNQCFKGTVFSLADVVSAAPRSSTGQPLIKLSLCAPQALRRQQYAVTRGGSA